MRLGALAVFATVSIMTAGCNSLLDLKLPPDVDHDNDNRPDRDDNCPDVTNADQSDFDHDGVGDACDECDDGGADDVDGDGIPDGCDGCVGNGQDADHDGVPDNCDGCLESGVDKDNDGIDDACDDCVGSGFDSDSDGIDDACDPCLNKYVDVDMDGIDDGCDACIESGKDADGDGVDDACDPCTLGPQHDEDTDGVYDACDNCKALANPGQADGGDPKGPDGVGERCDGDLSVDHEIFDAFDSDKSAWYVQGANWDRGNDAMRYLGGAGTVYRSFGSASSWFTVSSDIHPATSTFNPGGYGVYASIGDLQPAATRMECIVQTSSLMAGGRMYARVFKDDATTPVSQGNVAVTGGKLTLTMTVNEDSNALTMTCSDGGTGMVTLPLASTGVVWTPGIVAQNNFVDFRYFDVITR